LVCGFLRRQGRLSPCARQTRAIALTLYGRPNSSLRRRAEKRGACRLAARIFASATLPSLRGRLCGARLRASRLAILPSKRVSHLRTVLGVTSNARAAGLTPCSLA
jgi:hypothetical protein